jgi:hypothetical protein
MNIYHLYAMHKMPWIQILAVVTLFSLVFEISERNMLNLARFEIFSVLLIKIEVSEI